MSGKKLLLDTNIIIKLFSGDQGIAEQLKNSEEVFIPTVVLGELFYGAEQSAHRTANISKIEAFAKSANILNCDIKTAKHYGQVKAQLKSKGTPIPENDIWIAAIAIQHKLSLVTRDKHFDNITTLHLTKW